METDDYRRKRIADPVHGGYLMCGFCGCGENETHTHSHENAQTIAIEQKILAANDHLAALNRKYFQENDILALNVMSAPGAGKTTLLAQTIADLKSQFSFQAIVGDQQTDRDAQRISQSGIQALQINTGKGCHLDAHAVHHALEKMPNSPAIFFIENVGNLVCPALFDLGETDRIVMLSVTEGADKPLKYPHIFHTADLVLLTKTDLLPYVEFNIKECMEWIHRINPRTQILQISTKTGENLTHWYRWLNQK